MSPSPSNPASDLAMNLVFGLTGTLISAVTAYQGHKFWKLWRQSQGDSSTHPDSDVELGPTAATGTALHEHDPAEVDGHRDADEGFVEAETTRGRDRSRRRNLNGRIGADAGAS